MRLCSIAFGDRLMQESKVAMTSELVSLASTAMILAAGRGERMRPVTDSLPKPLVEVAGKPLIQHHVERLAAAGIQRVVINLAHLGQQIVDALGDGSRWGVDIHYSWEPEESLETAGGIIQALDFLDSKFIVVNGDIWTDYDFSLLRECNLGNHLAHLVMVETPGYKPRADFSLSSEGFLLPLASVEDAGTQGSLRDCTYSGMAVMSKEMFVGQPKGRNALLPLFNAAIDQARLQGEYYAGVWDDIGTVPRLEALREQLARTHQ